MEGPSPDLRVEGECVIGVGVGGVASSARIDQSSRARSAASLFLQSLQRGRGGRLGSQVRIHLHFSPSSRCIFSLKGKRIYLEIMIFTNFGGHKYAVVQCTIHKQQEYYKSYIWVRFKQLTGQQLNLFNRSPATYINTEADIAPDREGHLKRI